MPVDDTELEDFGAVLRERGLPERDFQVLPDSDPLPAGPAQETGRVTVRCRSTGAERTYETGSGTAWVSKFVHDLDEKRYS